LGPGHAVPSGRVANTTVMSGNGKAYDPKAHSAVMTDGRDRAPARAMFKAIGFGDDDLRKPTAAHR
jgi:hypothetical protein